PPATAHATSANTRPRSCTSNRDVANTRDNPPVNPDRSANNRNTANPACDTTPSPSAVTTNPRDQPLPFTWKVLLDLGPIRLFDNPYRPSSGPLSAVDTPIKHGTANNPR